MSVDGNWVLHFSWGATNNYSQTNITFNTNRTFSGPGTGQWRQLDGTLMLSFDTGPAKYGGNLDGNVASGAMSTFGGLNGSWYLVKQGTTGAVPQASASGYDPAGNRI
jgi:hypothetical protein